MLVRHVLWDTTLGGVTDLSSRRLTPEERSPGTFHLQVYGGFCSQYRNPFIADGKVAACTSAFLRRAVRA